MTAMEAPVPASVMVPLLHRIELKQHPGMVITVDLVENNLFRLRVFPVLHGPRGGLYCDEPGMGKAITALALVLKTLGTEPAVPEGLLVEGDRIRVDDDARIPGQVKSYEDVFAFGDGVGKRFAPRRIMLFSSSTMNDPKSPSHDARSFELFGKLRGVHSIPSSQSLTKPAKLFLSTATIVVVPKVLVDHWCHRIKEHVVSGRFRVLVVMTANDIPGDPSYLATAYNVVIVSFDAIS